MEFTEKGVSYLSKLAPLWLCEPGKNRGSRYLGPLKAGHASFVNGRASLLRVLNLPKNEVMFFALHAGPSRFSSWQLKAKVPEAIEPLHREDYVYSSLVYLLLLSPFYIHWIS